MDFRRVPKTVNPLAVNLKAVILTWLAAISLATAPIPGLAGGDIVDVGPIFVPDFSAGGVGGVGAAGASGQQGAASAADSPEEDLFAGLAGGGQTASGPATDRIVSGMTESIAFCAAIATEEYHIDCLSERFQALAERLPESGDYADVRTALESASRQLSGVVAANRAFGKPNATVRATGSDQSAITRPLRPVRTANLAAASAQATAIIAETETVLLRSATQSAARQQAFQRVSAVVGSAKVLLRSA